MTDNADNKAMGGLIDTLFAEKDPYEILAKEIGPAVIQYRYKWNLAEKELIKFSYPLHLNIELAYGCNLRCEFCAFSLPRKEWQYTGMPGDKISFDKYCEIIDEGAERGLCSVALNGYNEPLLQHDIVKYINYAENAGILDISLHTNGILLTSEMSRELIGSGLTGIMFSIDAGTAQTYKKIRRSDDFDKVVQNVVDFQAQKEKLGSKLPLTRVSFVDNKINHAELGDFVTFWQNKIDFIVVQSFCNPFIGTNRYKEIEKKYRINNKPFDVCAESYRRMTITCDGNIFPCCIYFGLELQMGNIYENSIHDVWNGEKMEQLRLLVNGAKDMQPEACRKCRASVVSCKQEK